MQGVFEVEHLSPQVQVHGMPGLADIGAGAGGSGAGGGGGALTRTSEYASGAERLLGLDFTFPTQSSGT